MGRFWDSFAHQVAPGIIAGQTMYLRGQQANRDNMQAQILQEKLNEMRQDREAFQEASNVSPFNTVTDVSGEAPAYNEGSYQMPGIETERQVPKSKGQFYREQAKRAEEVGSPTMAKFYADREQDYVKQQATIFTSMMEKDPRMAVQFANRSPEIMEMTGGLKFREVTPGSSVIIHLDPRDDKTVLGHTFVTTDETGKKNFTTKTVDEGKAPTDMFKTYRASIPRMEGESDTDYNARVFTGYEQHLVKVAGEKRGAAIQAQNEQKNLEGFKSWTPEAKKQAFMFNMITGEPPVSTKGMASGDRQVYAKDYGQWIVDNGFNAQDVALMRTDFKAGDMSLKNMAKQEAPMNAFVLNINKQVDKLGKLFQDAERSGLRIMDLPMREIRVRAKGSGKEAVLASYLLEVSNEIGKLSSGASGSVQQLSDSAKEDWKKVHDVNLSPKEIMYVLNATKDQANMRISTWQEAKDVVRQQISGIGEKPQSSSGGTSLKERAIAELKRRGKL